MVVPIEGEEAPRLAGGGGSEATCGVDKDGFDVVFYGEVISRGDSNNTGTGYGDSFGCGI